MDQREGAGYTVWDEGVNAVNGSEIAFGGDDAGACPARGDADSPM